MVTHAAENQEIEELQPGTRVQLLSAAAGVELRSPYGTIVRPDEWMDYYVIRLDQPAIYHRADGATELLPEICESLGNLSVIS